MNKFIEIQNLSKVYQTIEKEIKALDNLNLEINKGEIVAIVGPSGCGKSTLLSIIAELDNDYYGKVVKDSDIKTAYMLQSDALLPWLTIYENALLGLKIQDKLAPEYLEYVNYLFKFYNLEDFKNTYPDNISGGMKQRVALIRTLALKPNILLLDEPFSALDGQSRLIISNDVYKIAKKENITVILVTHSIEEAIYFSDRIVVLSKRPAKIKNIHDVNIDNKNDIYTKRKSPIFNELFDIIWKDLDYDE